MASVVQLIIEASESASISARSIALLHRALIAARIVTGGETAVGKYFGVPSGLTSVNLGSVSDIRAAI
jgi:hypothetical protein